MNIMKTTRWGVRESRRECIITAQCARKTQQGRDEPRNHRLGWMCHLKDGNGVGQTGGE